MNGSNMEEMRELVKREDACHKRARKYKFVNNAVIGTFLFLSCVCLFLPLFWLWRILLFLAFWGAMLVFESLLQKKVTKILTYEMDPLCYHTVINELQMKSKYGTEELTALVAEGQLAQAVAFAENKIPQVKNKYIRERLRLDALRASFRMGDLQKLGTLIEDFEKAVEMEDPNGNLMKIYAPTVALYKTFLSGNYIACKAYRSKVFASVKKISPYEELTVDYLHGVFCYYNDEPYLARPIFNSVAEDAPWTVEGRLSAAFLERMAKEEKGEEHASLQEIFKSAFC